MDNPFLFPRLMHGDRKSVWKSWRPIMKHTAETGVPGFVINQGDWIDVRDTSDGIILARGYGNIRAREVGWRPYVITHTLPNVFRGPRNPEIDGRANRLLLDGMRRYLWWCIGMLCYEDAEVRAPLESPERDEVFIELLRYFVQWLPEMQSIASRFGDEVLEFDRYWMGRILYAIRWSGRYPTFPDDAIETIWNTYDGNVSQWMIDNHVITSRNGRFELA